MNMITRLCTCIGKYREGMNEQVFEVMMWIMPLLVICLIGVITYAYQDAKSRSERHIGKIFNQMNNINSHLAGLQRSHEMHIEELVEVKKEIKDLYKMTHEQDKRLIKLEK